MPINQQIPADVLAAWDRGDKIEAIRALREATGLGLKEAKEALESGAYVVQASKAVSSARPTIPKEVAAALRRGDKIEAIKLAREASGVGLKEAKEAVEAMAGEAEAPLEARSRQLAPGEVPRGTVSWASIITFFGVAIVVALVAYRNLRP